MAIYFRTKKDMTVDTEMLAAIMSLGKALEKAKTELMGFSHAAGISISNEKDIIQSLEKYENILKRPDVQSAMQVLEHINSTYKKE